MANTDYSIIVRQGLALTEGVTNLISNLANISSLVFHSLEKVNWAGFYLADADHDRLLLGPFQGRPACTVIPFGKGVCGTAFQSGEPVIVPDVRLFPGHIACDPESLSEIVIPFRFGGCAGVLDIDSPETGRFSENDKNGLVKLISALEKQWSCDGLKIGKHYVETLN